MIDIDTSHRRKLLFMSSIAFFSLTIYFRFLSHKSNIQRGIVFTEKPPPPSIGGFYHFATVANPWKSIVIEQMSLAHLSGLIDVSSSIYVTGLGNIEQNKSIYDIFTNSKFFYDYNNKTYEYEYPTLKKLERFCLRNNESLVWYAHSKGASHTTDLLVLWRTVMNHFVLDKWRLCHGLLSSTNYTTCGSILTFDSVRKAGWNTYYAGNMWWAKCSHINRLTRIEKLDQNDRYMAELYVTSEPDVGHFNCYFTNPHEAFEFRKDTASCTVNQPLWKVR